MSLPQQSGQVATRIVCEGPIGAQARSTWTTTPLEDAQCRAAARTDRRNPRPRGVALRVLLLFYRCKLSSDSIAVGVEAGVNITDANHVICIGTAGANLSGSCFIGNIFGTTSGGGTSVLINSDGQLGTMTSSGRFKEKIKPMEQASDALFALKPVTFRYKREIDAQQIPQFGLVAEDVEKVNPDLVVRDKEGKPYSVRYDAVNAMLLNEFLKEHQKVEKLEATVAQQHRDFEAAVAELKGQIQKVSAQLEVNRPAPQVTQNNE